jgi:uroporphyrinogen-III synthase
VRYLNKLLGEVEKPSLAVVGAQTAAEARKLGFNVIFMPTQANGEGLAMELPDVAGKSCLVVRARAASPELAARLRLRGALVEEVALYETRTLGTIDNTATNLFLAAKVDVLIFASPSAVRGFRQRLTADALHVARDVPVVALGNTTRAALEEAGFRHIHVAAEPNIQSVIDELKGLMKRPL